MKNFVLHKEQKSLVRTKKRVSDHGEVFTSEQEINAMLDLVKVQTESIDAKFLEPACGNGNFLAEILRRKLEVVEARYKKNQSEYERYSIVAVGSIYGIDLLPDNRAECIDRLYQIWNDKYTQLYKKSCNEACRQSAKFVFQKNIILWNALDFKTVDGADMPITFSEWIAINWSMIKRKDYRFRFLVEKSYQTELFDENNQPKWFDDPVRDFPPVHFLKLAENV